MAPSRPHRRAVAAGALLLLAVVALVVGLAEGGAGTTRPADVPSLAEARADVAGAPAPLARLYAPRGASPATGGVPVLDLDRAGVRRLLAGLRGRPVLVNVWYPSCDPCRREFPILRRAAATLGTRMAFVGLVTQDSDAQVAAFLREEPTVYPHVRDPGGRIARADLEAGVAFPSSVLLDAAGEVVEVKAGEYASLAELEEDLRTRLGVGAPAAAGRATSITTQGAAR